MLTPVSLLDMAAILRYPVNTALKRRVLRLGRLAAAALVVALSGCAPKATVLPRPHPEALSIDSPLRDASLEAGDAWLRHYLMRDQPGEALALLEPGRREVSSDRLLRALQEALVLRRTGDFMRSNELLEWAEQEAERRRVRSVSRTAGSFLVNDGVMSYVPRTGEAVMIPYYRMMNNLAVGDSDAAAVEARRLSALLLDGGDSGVRSCRAYGMLQYVSGLVFESVGEMDDALVSLRQADASFQACAGARSEAPAGLGADLYRLASRLDFDEVADSAASWYAIAPTAPAEEPMGEVVVLLERGFVAHIAEATIHVPILEEEIAGLESADSEGIAAAAARITARLVNNFGERGYWGASWDDHPAVQVAQALGGAYILKLAWPTVAERTATRPGIRLLIGGDTVEASALGDLSAVTSRDVEDARAGMLGRLVTRGLAKYLVSREVEKKVEKEGGELLGFITGRLANAAANGAERADTRSWSLLPEDVAVARLTLPPGSHRLTLETFSPSGQPLLVELDPIEVTAGVTIVNERIWSGHRASRNRSDVAGGW